MAVGRSTLNSALRVILTAKDLPKQMPYCPFNEGIMQPELPAIWACPPIEPRWSDLGIGTRRVSQRWIGGLRFNGWLKWNNRLCSLLGKVHRMMHQEFILLRHVDNHAAGQIASIDGDTGRFELHRIHHIGLGLDGCCGLVRW